ncbi:MAG: hypothetical protein M1838_004657 [Thelocarpon superellum]|nr:MAG: hypothetical protein M1838_004657 [Thelocarpon superellum]
MVVNTRTNTVTDLTLRSLSGWAESELGTWIRSRASDDRKAIGRDISGICWAISRYWEAAEQRARFWIECEEEFGDLLPQSLGLATSKTKTSRQGHSKSKSWAREDDDDDDNDAVTRRELLAHLPTRSMTFSSWASHQNHNHKQRTPNSKVKPYSFMGPTIRLTWNIGLDWAGDVESRIFVTAAIPSSWKSKASAQAKGKAKGKGKGNGAAPGEIKGASGHEKDVAASIQAIFEDVRAKKGALVALRVVLGLLFPAS